MRIALVQPPYPARAAPDEAQKTIDAILAELRQFRGQTDLVVLPEYSNAPGLDEDACALDRWLTDNPPQRLLDQCCLLAREGQFLLAVNLLLVEDGRRFNRTHLISRSGEVVARYNKVHLPESEVRLGVEPGRSAAVASVEGVRFTFATCFDLYFPEFFERLAALGPDLILVPSYQRSENCESIRTQCAARALDAGAYLLRASYSMGPESHTGGTSLIATPAGDLLLDLGQKTGAAVAELDPKARPVRPAYHGGPSVSGRAAVGPFRRPETYRPAGPGTLGPDTPFPRIVAHRGASGISPENTLPAFAIGLAQGATEAEFDLWLSADREPVVCHCPTLDRTTTGSGPISEHSLKAIRDLDAGVKFSPLWEGTRVPLFEELFEFLAGRAFMNIHVKDPGEDGFILGRIQRLAEYWGIEDQVYIAGDRQVLELARQVSPDIPRCCLEAQEDAEALIRCATELECQRLQFGRSGTTDDHLRKAQDLGLITNYFYSDDPAEAARLIKAGVMALLTNYPGRMSHIARY